MKIVAVNFGKQDFTFVSFGALNESPLPDFRFCGGARSAGSIVWQNKLYVFGGNLLFGGEKNEALDDVAQFAHVARPNIFAQFGDGIRGERYFLPAILRGNLAGEMGDE